MLGGRIQVFVSSIHVFAFSGRIPSATLSAFLTFLDILFQRFDPHLKQFVFWMNLLELLGTVFNRAALDRVRSPIFSIV